jgi:hypothetical protein
MHWWARNRSAYQQRAAHYILWNKAVVGSINTFCDTHSICNCEEILKHQKIGSAGLAKQI